MSKLSVWWHRNIWYRFSFMGRLLHSLEYGDFKKVLRPKDYERLMAFIDRQAYIPYTPGVVLRLHMTAEDGPWNMWAVYEFRDSPCDCVVPHLYFDSLFIPMEDDPSTYTEAPEEIQDWPIFEVEPA